MMLIFTGPLFGDVIGTANEGVTGSGLPETRNCL